MCMQNLDVIHGRPSFRAAFLIACLNMSGRFSPLQYRIEGEGMARTCTAHARELDSGDTIEGPPVSMQMAKDEGWSTKAGSKWKTMPQQMLMYRSAMFFARAYCPEALLGMQSREELYDVGAVEMVSNGAGSFAPEPTTEDLAAQIMGDAPPVNGVTNHEHTIKAQIKSVPVLLKHKGYGVSV